MTTRRAASSSRRTLWLVGVTSLVGGVLLGTWVGYRAQQPPSGTTTAATGVAGQAAGSQRSPGPRDALVPVRLEIETIDVATRVIRLGLKPDHTVEVPSDGDDAGWFQRGATPGRRGSAVILGHVDSPEGPAVFARLQELRPGDAVSVERADGSTVSFAVRRSVTYANADFPARRVYAARDGRRLNLVTCAGAYDSRRGGYQSNLVVYTRRVRDPLG